jgi:hypothetical protein
MAGVEAADGGVGSMSAIVNRHGRRRKISAERRRNECIGVRTIMGETEFRNPKCDTFFTSQSSCVDPIRRMGRLPGAQVSLRRTGIPDMEKLAPGEYCHDRLCDKLNERVPMEIAFNCEARVRNWRGSRYRRASIFRNYARDSTNESLTDLLFPLLIRHIL